MCKIIFLSHEEAKEIESPEIGRARFFRAVKDYLLKEGAPAWIEHCKVHVDQDGYHFIRGGA